jgi:hypothetical protein
MRHEGVPVIKRLHWVSDFCATRLALVFGFDVTIWVFFTIPLIAELFPVNVQAKVFYYASGWVQLFALPLMVYVSNKIQLSSDRQSAAQTELLTEIRRVARENRDLNREIRKTLIAHEQVAAELRDHISHEDPPPSSG